jgi:hypothetical protein
MKETQFTTGGGGGLLRTGSNVVLLLLAALVVIAVMKTRATTVNTVCRIHADVVGSVMETRAAFGCKGIGLNMRDSSEGDDVKGRMVPAGDALLTESAAKRARCRLCRRWELRGRACQRRGRDTCAATKDLAGGMLVEAARTGGVLIGS